MRIIDFRLRPPARSYLETTMYADIERTARGARNKGFDVAPSAREKSMPLLIEEMDAAGIEIGFMPGRSKSALGSMSNEDLLAIAKDYPGRLMGWPAITTGKRKAMEAQVDKAIDDGFTGVVLEPGLMPEPMHLEDRRLYPVYAYLEDRHIPVAFMAGGNAGPDASYTSPEHIDRVAGDFPNLTIVSSHGNWPWVSQIIHVCYRRANIILSPDTYMFNMPGSQDYVNAVNTFMYDRFLFGSAYPFLSLQSAVDGFLKLGIREEHLEKVFFTNAAKLLGLPT